ncbi:hypothetical protein DES34_101285 [Brevibacillus brevis]|nr:hypothetical protein DES34_101285 [Brevibacillus brevis]VEF89263.1 Uncharacterised protein [Brevibacillus brevis]
MDGMILEMDGRRYGRNLSKKSINGWSHIFSLYLGA